MKQKYCGSVCKEETKHNLYNGEKYHWTDSRVKQPKQIDRISCGIIVIEFAKLIVTTGTKFLQLLKCDKEELKKVREYLAIREMPMWETESLNNEFCQVYRKHYCRQK